MRLGESELLADLTRGCQQRELFALEFQTGQLSITEEEAYAWRLIDVGEELLRHARKRQFP